MFTCNLLYKNQFPNKSMKNELQTGVKVGDLMTRNFIWVHPSLNLKKCAKTMVKKRVGSLIIKIKPNKLVGILTEKDIVWAVVKKSKQDLDKILAKDLMKRKVITIKPSADITEAMEKMKKAKVRRLPVVHHGVLVGMLTINDILKIDPGLFQLIVESVRIKEESKKLKRHKKLSRKAGNCEDCGEFDLLYKDDNQWLCESCYDSK